MCIQKVYPYKTVENESFSGDTILKIAPEDFEKIPFQDGKITFTFIGCLFRKILIENTESIVFKEISLQFVGCYIEEIVVNFIQSDNISLYFNSSIVSGRFDSNKLRSISFNNCISQSFYLINQNSIDISYTEENIFPLRWNKLFKSLVNADYKTLLKTNQSYHILDSKKVNFRTNEIKTPKKGIYRRKYELNKEYKIGYYLNDSQKKLFNLNLSIVYSKEVEDSETRIIGSLLNSLTISGYSNGKIFVENTKIDNWYIRDFSIKNEANFFNIGPLNLFQNESKLEINKCNLDNTWFDNIDFTKYETVSLYRTKFGKTTFTSCNFPKDYTSFEKFKTLENVHYPSQKSDNYYKDQYEIFLQLKVLMESSGNFYESQKLQAISNDALKKIKDISSWDKAILFINSKSNNHGLSIKLPLQYFLIFSISFYILYLLSLGRIFNSGEIDYSLVGYYFSFIDLTHRTDFLVDKNDFNFASLSIDFLNKIISGFFIYQFISSFRKYGKRK